MPICCDPVRWGADASWPSWRQARAVMGQREIRQPLLLLLLLLAHARGPGSCNNRTMFQHAGRDCWASSNPIAGRAAWRVPLAAVPFSLSYRRASLDLGLIATLLPSAHRPPRDFSSGASSLQLACCDPVQQILSPSEKDGARITVGERASCLLALFSTTPIQQTDRHQIQD